MSRVTRAALLALVVALGLLRPLPVAAQDVDTGELEIVDESGDPMEGGGSTTPFTLALPDGAACPGDSANDNYVVNSYMVPESVDPASVTYDGLGPAPIGLGPDGEVRQPLYDVRTSFFVGVQTADRTEPGGPGAILEPPMFDLDVFKPGEIPPGRYNVGLACTQFVELRRLWNAQILVEEDPEDEPAQLRWSVVGFVDSDDSSDAPVALYVAIAVAGAAAAAVLILRRRRVAR